LLTPTAQKILLKKLPVHADLLIILVLFSLALDFGESGHDVELRMDLLVLIMGTAFALRALIAGHGHWCILLRALGFCR